MRTCVLIECIRQKQIGCFQSFYDARREAQKLLNEITEIRGLSNLDIKWLSKPEATISKSAEVNSFGRVVECSDGDWPWTKFIIVELYIKDD